jgi:hypothetical protein
MRVWGSIVIAAFIVLASVVHGYSGSRGPFADLAGSWSGPGTVTLAEGAKENIRCRASYEVAGGGSNLAIKLRCSSDSFRIDLLSTVSHANGAIEGRWSEATNRIGGGVSGKASGDRVQAIIDGPFAAMLEISTRADRQSVSIQSPGGKVSKVSILLSRG